MWVTYHDPQEQGKFKVDDPVDIVIASEENWTWPFDTDSQLLSDLGVENISYSTVDLNDGLPDPVLVGFHHVHMGDAINMLSKMGITEIVVDYKGDTYTVRLDDAAPDEYQNALIYDEDENLILSIDLL